MSFNQSEDNQGEHFFEDFRINEASFEAFFKTFYPRLCVYCKLKYGFDIDLAEDVVNTSFIKLWEARQTLATDISPKSYLYKIIDNSSLNLLKHQKVQHRHAHHLLATTSEVMS